MNSNPVLQSVWCHLFGPSLVSSADFMSVVTIPSSKVLMKILNRTQSMTEPCGTPLDMLTPLDREALITTLKVIFQSAVYPPDGDYI